MAVQPIDPELLAWFKDYVNQHSYSRTEWDTGLSPNTISRILKTGEASKGTTARIEALRRGDNPKPETMAVRQQVSTLHAARMIALAAEAFPPERQRLILDALPPDVRESMAVKAGALKPLPSPAR